MHITDEDMFDVKCYYGAALTVTTDAADDTGTPVVPEVPAVPETPVVAPTPPAKVETARY